MYSLTFASMPARIEVSDISLERVSLRFTGSLAATASSAEDFLLNRETPKNSSTVESAAVNSVITLLIFMLK